MKRLMTEKNNNEVTNDCLLKGRPVFFFYRSPKMSEKEEWKSGHIEKAELYIVYINTGTKKVSRVAVEDVRIQPNS